jgi:hypothetical protein
MKKDKKVKIIPVKASVAEKRAFTQLALTRNTTLSALVRELLHRESTKEATA